MQPPLVCLDMYHVTLNESYFSQIWKTDYPSSRVGSLVCFYLKLVVLFLGHDASLLCFHSHTQ